MANPFQSPAILSFCPGILGIERGLERVIGPTRVVAYVEIEAFIIANLLAGMEAGVVDCAPIWTDAKTFPAQHFHNKVHGIIGGYPCQPFSIAGNRQGTADPRHLWPYLQRSIEAIKPVWCFFENVDDHLNLGFDHVHQQLCDLGYAVEAGIYSASEAGAPHQRQRLFILAIANGARYGWQQQRGFQPEIIGSGEEMEHANNRPSKQHNAQKRQIRKSDKASKLGNTQHYGHTAEPQLRSYETDGNQWRQKEQKAAKQPTRTDRPIDAASLPRSKQESELANTNSKRGQLPTEWKQSAIQQPFSHHAQRIPQWPARPSQPQYEWEEPRTIESGMGCTVNGYNFREDFLRALGNSVVEQTAAIAFTDLINKHGLAHLVEFEICNL